MRTKLAAAVLASSIIGTATLFAGSATPDGTDFVVSADSGETYTYSTAIGNYSRLVKRGAGEVELTVAASGFAGSVVIEEGTLTIKNTSAVGSKTPVTVNNGATLWLKLPGANSTKFAGHELTIAGKGVGETVHFGGLLGYAPIMPVKDVSCAAFVNRGGRIPAPIHSFKN